ncbi:MAG: hypothetical protein ABIF88_03225 [archaeon]
MKRHYILDPTIASCGRTLWNNLIVGPGAYLNNPRYVRITREDGMNGTCKFQYENGAEVTVIATNNVKIEAEDEDILNESGKDLEKLCDSNGLTIFDLELV